jgi:hypothetical protein
LTTASQYGNVRLTPFRRGPKPLRPTHQLFISNRLIEPRGNVGEPGNRSIRHTRRWLAWPSAQVFPAIFILTLPPSHGRSLDQAEESYDLLVQGVSMIEDYICDGGIVVVTHHISRVESMEAPRSIDFFSREDGRVSLQTSNPQMEPIFMPGSERDCEWMVQGEVVAILVITKLHPEVIQTFMYLKRTSGSCPHSGNH